MDKHEKLQLSKQDLTFIYNQILNETLSKLDLHLPTTNDDPMKHKVTNLLHDFLKDVFEMAKNAMVIDGIDIGDSSTSISDVLSLTPREKTQPFDTELNSQLREILQNIEQETITVTQLRKNVPKDVDDKYSKVVQDVDQTVSSFLNELDSKQVETPTTNDIEIPRIQEIIGHYEAHLIQLNELKDTVPKQRVEVEKLGEIAEFLEDKSGSGF